MPKIDVDGQQHEVEDGLNLLEACTALGYDLTYFCWHPAMGSIGACRQCAVKLYRGPEDTTGRIAMACMTSAADGARLSILDPEAAEMRKAVIEWLMVNHPHDCPVCDEGGECQLQDMTVMAGHAIREFRFPKRTYPNQYLGPFVHHEMNRCIQCYRCTRFYQGHAGGADLEAFGAHDHVWFGRHEPGVLQSPFSGNLVEVCPTGVFTDDTQRQHYVRKWDLTTAPSICPHCSSGCNITPGERTGVLRRIRNRQNPDVNGWFLCDRGRYGYEFVNRADRPREPLLGGVPAERAALDARIAELAGRKVAGVGSPRASLEGNFALQRLVGEDRFGSGLLAAEQLLVDLAVRVLREGPAPVASLGEIEREVDAVLVLGEDVLHTAPRLALALRQAARNAPLAQARQRLQLPAWDDQALRDAIQDETGPFFVVGPDVTELDPIATATARLAPADVARLGFAVARELDARAPEVDLPEPQLRLARQIAVALRDARRPLVVSGTGLGSPAVLEAAAAVARALGRKARLSLAVPEANSVGASLLGGRSLEHLLALARAGEIEVLVVLENDLYRRAPAAVVDELLGRCAAVVVLEHLATRTVARADLVLPAGTYAETSGTFVSSEGRAQRFFTVFEPMRWVRSSWRWVAELARAWGRGDLDWHKLDDVIAALAAARPDLAAVADAAEPASWRRHGQKAPRQTHRFSGRTALWSDRTMHDPERPADPDSPLGFTMEGTRDPLPLTLRSFVWAPGWSSEQAAARLTAEARQAGVRGTAGVRLFDGPAAPAPARSAEVPAAYAPVAGRYLTLLAPLVLGTEEQSSRARALSQLVPGPYVEVAADDAHALGVRVGDLVEVVLDGVVLVVPLRDSPGLPRGVARLPRDLPGLEPAWGTPLPALAEIRPFLGGR